MVSLGSAPGRSAVTQPPRPFTIAALRWLRLVGSVGGMALAGALGALLMAVLVVPLLAGASPYTITGRSMEPAIPLGSVVVVRPVSVEEIATGDIVTFQISPGSSTVATHRVIGFQFSPEGEREFVTKGDANRIRDARTILPVQLRGVVWYTVPWVGWIAVAVDESLRSWLIPAVAFALMALGVWLVVTGFLRRSRTRDRAGIGS